MYGRPGRGQKGGGFFSSLKRFLIPIGKALLPSVLGGASDVLLDKKPLKETLKRRGLEAGKRALGATMNTAGEMLGGHNNNNDDAAPPSPPPPKKYKRRSNAPKKQPVKRGGGKRTPTASWQ